MRSLLILFALASSSFAADLEVNGEKVNGTVTVKPYTLVRCECVTKGKGYGFWVFPVSGTAIPDSEIVGSRCLWTAVPGQSYRFLYAVTREDGSLDQGQAVITISRKTPDPVTPDPVTPDPVNVPDGYLGFTKVSYNASALRPKDIMKDIARNYSDVAGMINAGRFNNTSDALKELRNKNREGLNSAQIESLKPFFEAWQKKAQKEYTDGNLRSLKQHAEAFMATSKGIDLRFNE